jgi:hypothetical protein
VTLPRAIPDEMARPMQGEALLAAWERGAELSGSLRAAALLAAGCGLDEGAAAALDVPRRDAALLAIRKLSFGATLHGFAACEACAERLEFTLSVADLVGQIDAAAGAAGTLRYGDWSLVCRFATIADIDVASREAELAAARAVLLARCVSAMDASGRVVAFADLPADVREAGELRLVAMHEAAELSVLLPCAACGVTQDVALDPAEFLWQETRHAARRLLADVHELAWAYGWREGDIVAMSPARRAAYLALVRS